jgi:dienelactone hydrolase
MSEGVDATVARGQPRATTTSPDARGQPRPTTTLPDARGLLLPPVPLPGSRWPLYPALALTDDEIYVPLTVRKPDGDGPFPVISIGRGDGHGGLAHVIGLSTRLAPMQDLLLARGYAVAVVNYRNEIPRLYGRQGPAVALVDDISGGEHLVLKSAATLDSDDLAAIWRWLATLPWVRPQSIGAIGISHGGEMILKAVAAGAPLAAAVIAEGASHEFLSVDTTASAPRIDGELQYQDIEVVRAHADKNAAMVRIVRIARAGRDAADGIGVGTPMLHFGRERDHLQGIFRLAHEWMVEAGCDSQWLSMEHPEHGYCLLYPDATGALRPDPVQQQAFERWVAFFDQHLQPAR